MLAYHGDPQLKEQFLTLLKWHQEVDKIVQGIYWDDGRGCAAAAYARSKHYEKMADKLIELLTEAAPEVIYA